MSLLKRVATATVLGLLLCGPTVRRATAAEPEEAAKFVAANAPTVAGSPNLDLKDAQSCVKNHIYCVDDWGNALNGEKPPNLHEGESLQISVLPRGDLVGSATQDCTIELDPPSPAASKTVHVAAGTNATSRQRFDFPVLSNLPASGVSVRMRVACQPKAPPPVVWPTVGSAPSVDAPMTFAVGKPGYLFEPVLLFPVVFNGVRTVTAAPFANGRNAVISDQNQTAGPLGPIENLSFGLNMYPFGGYPGTCADGAVQVFTCNERIYRALTLQAAIAIANNAFRNFYFGGGLAPIRGVTLTGGMAVVQGQFLTSAVFPGEVISTAQASNVANFYSTHYMIEPYFGVAISPDVVGTLASALSSIKGLAQTHSSD